MALEPLTWKQTRTRLRADKQRLLEFLNHHELKPRKRLFLHPAYLCVVLYRWSNHFYRRNHRYFARLLWHLNVVFTGADISEPNELDEGLLIPNPPGIAIMGKAGRNLTVMACAGLGSELGRWEDVGAGPGLPVVGDDVLLEPHCGILGPIQVGSRVRLTAGTVITEDIPDDTLVEGPRARVIRRQAV